MPNLEMSKPVSTRKLHTWLDWGGFFKWYLQVTLFGGENRVCFQFSGFFVCWCV